MPRQATNSRQVDRYLQAFSVERIPARMEKKGFHPESSWEDLQDSGELTLDDMIELNGAS